MDTIGDESKASKVPVISLNDFMAFLLKWLPGFHASREFQVTPTAKYLLCGMSVEICEIFTRQTGAPVVAVCVTVVTPGLLLQIVLL